MHFVAVKYCKILWHVHSVQLHVAPVLSSFFFFFFFIKIRTTKNLLIREPKQ